VADGADGADVVIAQGGDGAVHAGAEAGVVTEGPARRPPARGMASVHLAVALVLGALTGVVVGLASGAVTGALSGWTMAASTFTVWTWAALWPLEPAAVREHATAEDPGTAVRDFLLVGIGAVSLVVVVLVLFRGKQVAPETVILGIAAIAGSWVVLHTVYALRYARLFYADVVGGLDFQQKSDPTYRDFAYLAFTVGMTFQVSDTEIEQTTLRTAVLRHALLSFCYNTIVVAVTINVVAGLGGK
jgi:uncharacterized membrane protein